MSFPRFSFFTQFCTCTPYVLFVSIYSIKVNDFNTIRLTSGACGLEPLVNYTSACASVLSETFIFMNLRVGVTNQTSGVGSSKIPIYDSRYQSMILVDTNL